MKEKLSYDAEQDVLYFNEGEPAQDSLDIGDVYLEFSGEGKIVGIEVLEASDTIAELTGGEFSKEDLEEVKDAEIKVYKKGDFAFVVLQFVLKKEGGEVRESIGVNVPSNAVAA